MSQDEQRSRLKWNQASVFTLTFLSYLTFHSSRKAFSNAKNNLSDTWGFSTGFLGVLDTLFLIVYALGLFGSGYLGDRVSLRYFLVIGMVLSGGLFALFGAAEQLDVKAAPWFFATVIMFTGLVQSVGWPTNVAILGNWVSPERRGRVFGWWSANAAVGNIVGSLMVAYCSYKGYAIIWMFALPAILSAVVAVLVFLFLKEHPRMAGLPDIAKGESIDADPASKNLLSDDISADADFRSEPLPALTFAEVMVIPNVLNYAMAFFCLKFVTYACMFWLPYYLHHGLGFETSKADLYSNTFDVGCILGGVVAGHVSDLISTRSPVVISMLLSSVFAFQCLQHVTDPTPVSVVIGIVGFLLGGPSSLIASAVPADLGTHPSVINKGNGLALITGVIDGVGSIGAALAQIVVAYAVVNFGWIRVFSIMMFMCAMSGLCIARAAVVELQELKLARTPKKDMSTSGFDAKFNAHRNHAAVSSRLL